MSSERRLISALAKIMGDTRVTPWNICLFAAILHYWCENGYQMPIYISRNKLMSFAHIGSIVTYHKCIRQLTELGYIDYFPSYNPYRGTIIFLKTKLN